MPDVVPVELSAPGRRPIRSADLIGCGVMGFSLLHSAADEFVAPGRSKLVTA